MLTDPHIKERYAAEVQRYEALFNAFTLEKKFTDGGYDLRVYRVRP